MSTSLKARVHAGHHPLTPHLLRAATLALLGTASFATQAAMTVTLSSSSTSPTVGQTVTLTGTAKNGTLTISGPVTFKDGSTVIGSVNASSGVAKLTTPAFTSPGSHSYTASYTFKSLFSSTTVTSTAVGVTVNKATSTTTLGSLPAATVGQPVALTAQVSGYKPGGTVTFTDTTSKASVAATLDANGKASASMTFATGGAHTLTASYAGDTNNVASSTASGSTLTVAKLTPSVTLASDTVVRWAGSSTITLQAALTGSPQAGGQIKFMDSFNGAAAQQVGSAALTSGNTAAVTLALSGVGKHQVTAVFPGDAANNSATSNASAVTTVAAPAADAGSPAQYPTRVYVDVAAPTCVPTATQACGTADRPWRNLGDAMKTVLPGTEVIVAGRDGFAYYLKDDGVAYTFSDQQFLSLPQYANVAQGASTAPTLIRKWAGLSAPVVRGTMKLGGWQRVDGGAGQYPNLYAVDWSVKAQGLAEKVTDANGNTSWTFPYIVRPQQVYRDSAVLEQVGGVLYNLSSYDDTTPLDNGPTPTTLKVQWPTRGGERPIGRITPAASTPWLSLQANQFYFDIASHTLYAKLASPLAAGETLEVSVQQFLLDTGNAANVTLRDLVFERSNGSAYSPQNTAVTLRGQNITADGITVRYADAICVMLSGTNVTLKNSTIDHCGQMGIAAGGSGHVIDSNHVLYNNAKGFSENWAAAGIKLMADGGVTNATVSNNEVAFNDGSGIWLDTNATGITISGNQIGLNGRIDPNTDTAGGGVTGFGVHLEAVDGNIVTGNTIVGNANAGVHLIGLSTRISGNLIAANLGPAISRPADGRLACPSASNSNNVVQQNRFAWNDEVVPNPVDPAHPEIKQQPNFITLYRWTPDSSDANAYCGTSIGLSSATESVASGVCAHTGQSVYNDLPTWRTLTGQDASSTLTLTAYSTTTRDQVISRSATLWDSVKAGTFSTNTASACHW